MLNTVKRLQVKWDAEGRDISVPSGREIKIGACTIVGVDIGGLVYIDFPENGTTGHSTFVEPKGVEVVTNEFRASASEFGASGKRHIEFRLAAGEASGSLEITTGRRWGTERNPYATVNVCAIDPQ